MMPPPAGTFTAITALAYFTCGIRSDSTLACWGPSTYYDPPTGAFAAIGGGWFHACAVRGDGTLACWGTANHGATFPPAGVFDSVHAGWYHNCAIRSDGTMACWGSLGGAPSGTYRAVAIGYQHACAVRTDGALACWGANYDGQASPPAGSFNAVSAGYSHNCALRADGTIACWGRNYNGQSNAPGGTFNAIAAGQHHTCAVRTDDTIACWGSDYRGQAPQPELRPLALADASTTADYSQQFGLVDVAPSAALDSPYTPPTPGFAVTAGTLPPGSGLAASGLLSGTPTAPGTFHFTVEGEDANGFAASRAYAVSVEGPVVAFGFIGFEPPVDNPPAINSANAGRTIPLKWRLVDAAGAPVDTLDAISLQAVNISCDGSAVVDEVETYTAEGAGFHNRGDGNYQYNWQPPASYQGTCKRLVLDLGDGSAHEALFRFH